MSKGYTISLFASIVKEATEKQLKKDLYKTISPRIGYMSEKSAAFDEWLGGEDTTSELVAGNTPRAKKLGKTVRTRLLTALKNRKTKGTVF